MNSWNFVSQHRIRYLEVQQGMDYRKNPHNIANRSIDMLLHFFFFLSILGLPCWLSGEKPTCQCRDTVSIPRSGRSPGEGDGNLLQYSCLGMPWIEKPGGLLSLGSRKSQTHISNNSKRYIDMRMRLIRLILRKDPLGYMMEK